MRQGDSLPGAKQASERLRLLLEGPYRRRWQEADPGPLPRRRVSYGAVAKVLAHRLSHAVPVAAHESELSRRARQAITGEELSLDTLDLFIRAFRMTAGEADQLRDLARGSDRIKPLTGAALPPAGLYEKVGPPRHQTIALSELHWVGPDRRPALHRTTHTLKAVVDGMDYYPYPFDTNAATVNVERGGRPGKVYRVEGTGFYAVNITFDRPLRLGETATFDYVTTFNYQRQPPPEFRRGVFRQVEKLHIEVRFHPDALPRRIWWAEWRSLDDHEAVKRREEVRLNSELAVRSHHERINDAIVGFCWDW